MFKRPILAVAMISLITCSSVALADIPVYSLTIKDNRFHPAELEVPVDTKFKLEVFNQDDTAEEFESYHLNREKIVAGKGKISLFIGPLEPGRYEYFGEFHPETAKGTIVAKENH